MESWLTVALSAAAGLIGVLTTWLILFVRNYLRRSTSQIEKFEGKVDETKKEFADKLEKEKTFIITEQKSIALDVKGIAQNITSIEKTLIGFTNTLERFDSQFASGRESFEANRKEHERMMQLISEQITKFQTIENCNVQHVGHAEKHNRIEQDIRMVMSRVEDVDKKVVAIDTRTEAGFRDMRELMAKLVKIHKNHQDGVTFGDD